MAKRTDSSADASLGNAGVSNASKRPPLYGKTVPLNANKHAGWRIAQARSFAFAATTNALPLTAVEFLSASRSFPIVFSLDAPHTPYCHVGLKDPVNLFLDDAHHWDPHAYIPAYVRRYPFLFLTDSNNNKGDLVLGMDQASKMISKDADGELLLSDSGEPTPFLQNAIDFCKDFNRQWEISLALSKSLKEHDLLVEEESTLTFPDRREVQLRGFLTIDEQKLNELPAELFVEWRDRGWLAPIYGVLASKLNWNVLVQRHVQRARDAAA